MLEIQLRRTCHRVWAPPADKIRLVQPNNFFRRAIHLHRKNAVLVEKRASVTNIVVEQQLPPIKIRIATDGLTRIKINFGDARLEILFDEARLVISARKHLYVIEIFEVMPLVGEIGGAHHHVRRIFFHRLEQQIQTVWQDHIIGIHEINVLADGTLKPDIANGTGTVLAADIFFELDDLNSPIVKRPCDLKRAIRRAIINQYQLEIGESLLEHRSDR